MDIEIFQLKDELLLQLKHLTQLHNVSDNSLDYKVL